MELTEKELAELTGYSGGIMSFRKWKDEKYMTTGMAEKAEKLKFRYNALMLGATLLSNGIDMKKLGNIVAKTERQEKKIKTLTAKLDELNALKEQIKS